MISKVRSSALLYHGTSPPCHDLAWLALQALDNTVAVVAAVAVAILPRQYPDHLALFVLIDGIITAAGPSLKDSV